MSLDLAAPQRVKLAHPAFGRLQLGLVILHNMTSIEPAQRIFLVIEREGLFRQLEGMLRCRT